MALPTPQQTIIDPNSDPSIIKNSIALATANGGISVFETTKDIYVTAVEENFNNQYITNKDVTDLTQNITNNPVGSNGSVQYYYDANFASDSGFVYDTANYVLNLGNLSISNVAQLGNVANVKINNGSNGQVLSTDGAGNLSWITPASNSPSGISNASSNVNVLSNAVILGANGQSNVIFITSDSTSATTTIANTVKISGDFGVGSNTSVAYINSNTVSFYSALINIASAANGGRPSGISDQRAYRGLLVNYPTSGITSDTAWFGLVNDGSNAPYFELATSTTVNGNVVSVNEYGDITLGTVTGNLVGNVSDSLFSNVAFTANTKKIGLTAPSTLTSNYTLTLPTSYGGAGQALTSFGNGALGWTTVPGANSFVSSNITGNGTVDFIGASNVSLGAVGNIHISGGSNGYVLSTNGTGNLSWVAQAGTPSNIINGNSNIQVYANANIGFSANGVSNIVVISSDVSVGSQTSPGIEVPYISVRSSAVGQFSEFIGNSDESVYFYLQNLSNGNAASSDIAISSDAGNATFGYIDVGIASSTYDVAGIPIIRPQDSYVLAVGNSIAGGNYSPGNLVLGAFTDGNSRVKIGAGGAYSNTNILITLGNGFVNIDGTTTNVSSNLNASGNASFTGANVSLGSVGNLKITGGANGQFLVANGASGGLKWTVPVFTYTLTNYTANSTAPTGTINFDVLSNAVIYNTTAMSGNVTLNFRGNNTTTINSLVSTGQSIATTYIVTTGSSAFGVTSVQIDSAPQTIKWLGGTTPTFSANSVTAYNFNILKTGTGAYTVLATQARYA